MSIKLNNHEKQTGRIARLRRHLLLSKTAAAADRGPLLDGIRVVELATVIAAPTAAALLADYGAEVIKIENPRAPDISRSWGRGDDPAKTAQPGLNETVEGGGSAFVQINRGKKSIALDPTKPEGIVLMKKLLDTADIFVTNVRNRSLKKLGLDYESLAPEFPRLVYGHLSAFGQAGPMVDDPGYDFGAFWAQSGVMDLIRSGEDASMPRFPGGIGDNTTAVQLLGGIFGALYDRERTGKGQLVDASLMRAGVWALAQPLASLYGGNGWAMSSGPDGGVRETTTLGERRTVLTQSPFRCKDGIWVHFLGLEVMRHLPAFCAALGVTEETLFGPGGLRVKGKEIDWRAATSIVDGILAQRWSFNPAP
eukprot:g2225.t1